MEKVYIENAKKHTDKVCPTFNKKIDLNISIGTHLESIFHRTSSAVQIHLHLPLYVVMHIVVTVQPSIDNIILWVSARGRSSRVVTYRIRVSDITDGRLYC